MEVADNKYTFHDNYVMMPSSQVDWVVGFEMRTRGIAAWITEIVIGRKGSDWVIR